MLKSAEKKHQTDVKYALYINHVNPIDPHNAIPKSHTLRLLEIKNGSTVARM